MKYVVIENTDDFIQSLGIFDDVNTAFGRAYLYIDESFDYHGDIDDAIISRPMNLEGDTGFVITATSKTTPEANTDVYVLFDDHTKKESTEGK